MAADPDNTPLRMAVARGNNEIVDQLIALGAAKRGGGSHPGVEGAGLRGQSNDSDPFTPLYATAYMRKTPNLPSTSGAF